MIFHTRREPADRAAPEGLGADCPCIQVIHAPVTGAPGSALPPGAILGAATLGREHACRSSRRRTQHISSILSAHSSPGREMTLVF